MKHLLSFTLAIPLAFSATQVAAAEETPKREKVEFPNSDIFLFDLIGDGGKLTLKNGKNVTALPGYENQPSFTKDSDSFLFSQSDDYQTDVFEYFLSSGETKQITKTPKNEFSPIASPDNMTISFVTETNRSVGHIKRSDPTKTYSTFQASGVEEPVGYYGWNHKSGYILFWSRYGFNVTLTHASKPVEHFVSGHAVPSTPGLIPGTGNFSFVHRQANGAVWIKELNPETRAVRPLVAINGSNSNYAWTPDGSILIIQNDMLYKWSPETKEGWVKMVDLSKHGIADASRIAVSPNNRKIAIVGKPKE